MELDEALARALEREMLLEDERARREQSERDARQAAASEDEELAKLLNAELNGPPNDPPSTTVEDDEELARKLAAELNGVGSAAVEQHTDDASLALALSLTEQLEHAAAPAARKPARPKQERGNGESEALRQALFVGPPCADAGGSSFMPAPPPARPAGGPSYAMVVGEDGVALPGMRAPAVPSAAPAALRPAPMTAAARTGTSSGHRGGPLVILDGANVAYSYAEARGHGDSFDAEGLVRAVDYFCTARTASSARRVARTSLIVTLNESRYDPTDPHLASLADVIAWTPVGKYDDLFTLQCAADHGSWVVTRDRWRDERARRHATEAIRRRVISFAWMGGSFAPDPDDLARFDAAAVRRD